MNQICDLVAGGSSPTSYRRLERYAANTRLVHDDDVHLSRTAYGVADFISRSGLRHGAPCPMPVNPADRSRRRAPTQMSAARSPTSWPSMPA